MKDPELFFDAVMIPIIVALLFYIACMFFNWAYAIVLVHPDYLIKGTLFAIIYRVIRVYLRYYRD